MSPQEATALHVLSYVLMHNGQPEKAAALLEAVDALRPGNPRTLITLATAHLRCGAATRALHALERSMHTFPNSPARALLKAQALGMLGRAEEAKASMDAFVAGSAEVTHMRPLPG